MSDVLHRLAMRVLTAPGGVRPRLGSRFEIAGAPAETESAEFAPQTAATIRGTPSPGRPAPRHAPAARPAPPAAASIPPPLPRSASEAESGMPADREPPVSGSARLPEPLVVQLIREEGQPLARESPNLVASTPVGFASPDREPLAAALPVATRAALRPAAERPAAPEVRADAPLLPAVSPPPAAPRPGPHPAPPAPAPDIQVSIGRIEIRADNSERRPARRAPTRPALMPLEYYLGKGRARR